jgi:Zinc finger, C2H2 type.
VFSTCEDILPYSVSEKDINENGRDIIWNVELAHQQGIPVGQEAHPCPNCGKVYSWKGSLTRHLSLECGRKPNQQCPYCQYVTKHKADLQKHIRRRHKGMPNV